MKETTFEKILEHNMYPEIKTPNNHINADKLKRRLKSSAPLICRLCRRYAQISKMVSKLKIYCLSRTYLKITHGRISRIICGMLRLSDDHWERIRQHFPEEKIPEGRPGRKPVPTRQVLEAVLWILNTGAQWHMLTQCYPNYKTVHRRFQNWCRSEVLRNVMTDLANALRDKGALDESGG